MKVLFEGPCFGGKSMMLGTASVLAAIATTLPVGAYAQRAGDVAAAAAPQSAPGVADDASDIVVTAQKREERLKDVPISASVLGGRQLDLSTSKGVSEELAQVPGVAFSKSTYSSGGLISVRGVSAGRDLYTGANPVAYYLDSVPFGFVQSSITPDIDAYDLSRVEALRGPQGTLYGASALAGVVRVLTNDPDLNKFAMKFRVGSSNTDDGGNNYRGDLAVNVPIIAGKLALRAVVGYQNLSGWIDTPIAKNTNGFVGRNYRFKLGAQPTDDLSIVGTVWLNRNDIKGVSAGRTFNFRDVAFDEPADANYDMYGLKINYDFHGFTLTSNTSRLIYDSIGTVDGASRFGGLHIPVTFGNDAKLFSQELLLASEGSGPWRWSAGAFYRDGKDIGLVDSPPIGLYLDWTNASKSYALFGEVTRLFADGAVEFTVGGRYFHDQVTSSEDRARAPANPPNYYRDQANYSSKTPRVVLTWHPTSQLTTYASYSQGFRSGSPQAYYTTSGVLGFPGMKPDKLFNYEVGAKGDWSIFSFDIAAYHMKWKDVQQAVTVNVNNVAIAALINGDSASGNGIDLGLTARPAPGLDIGGGVSWNNLASDTDIVDGGVVLFKKGDRLNNSPEYNYNAFMNYGGEIGSSGYVGKLSFSGNYTAAKCSRTTVSAQAVIACGDPVWTTRASFSVDAPNGWRLTAFVDNLNDFKKVAIGDPVWNADYQVRIRPRTVGLQFDYHL